MSELDEKTMAAIEVHAAAIIALAGGGFVTVITAKDSDEHRSELQRNLLERHGYVSFPMEQFKGSDAPVDDAAAANATGDFKPLLQASRDLASDRLEYAVGELATSESEIHQLVKQIQKTGGSIEIRVEQMPLYTVPDAA